MQTVRLSPTNLIAVTVPEDAYDIRIYSSDIWYNLLLSENTFRTVKDDNSIQKSGRYEIIGTVTKDGTCTFDWFEKLELLYKEFIFLLEANGIYLKNPMGDKPNIPCEPDTQRMYNAIDKYEKWQEYELKTLSTGSKLLIIKQI